MLLEADSMPIETTSTAVYSTVVVVTGQSNFIYLDFSRLAPQNAKPQQENLFSEAYQTMLASEAVLSRDWNSPEEDAAWANL